MPRADAATKPDDHRCCPNAARWLDCYSWGGLWSWRLRDRQQPLCVQKTLPLSFCPWCGEQLPRRSEPNPPDLQLVR
jgi:hypothetical protein